MNSRRPTSIESELKRARQDLHDTRRELARAQQRIRELETLGANRWPFAASDLERLHTAMTWIQTAAHPLTAAALEPAHTPNHDSTRTEGDPTSWARSAKRRVARRIRNLADYAEHQVSGETPPPITPASKTLRCTTRECRRSFPKIDGEGRTMERCSTCGGPLTPRDPENQTSDADKPA